MYILPTRAHSPPPQLADLDGHIARLYEAVFADALANPKVFDVTGTRATVLRTPNHGPDP